MQITYTAYVQYFQRSLVFVRIRQIFGINRFGLDGFYCIELLFMDAGWYLVSIL